jgi:hypothetical protein
MKKSIRIATMLVLSACLAACAGNKKIESDLRIKGAPDWVNEGTQAINNNEGRLLHGVGMAPPMGDASLQKATAENRARTEIAHSLSTYIDATLSDYTATMGTDAESSVERDIESTTQVALAGARIIGAWKDKRSDDIYAAAELDLQVLKRSLATSDNLSASFKDYFARNADANFDRFIEDSQP